MTNPSPEARPRRGHRWWRWVAVVVMIAVGSAWAGRTWWLGPLIAQSVVQVLEDQAGGRWQVEAVDGTWVSSVRVRGLTCYEPEKSGLIVRCRIESVTVTYRLWRCFSSDPLTAIDAVSIDGVDLVVDGTIDTSRIASSRLATWPPANGQSNVPWLAELRAQGVVEFITAAGRVRCSDLLLSGHLAAPELACEVGFRSHEIGHLQLAAHHAGASPTAGWQVDGRLGYASDDPVQVAVTLGATQPRLRGTVTVGANTRITGLDLPSGWSCEGVVEMAELAPALRRLMMAFDLRWDSVAVTGGTTGRDHLVSVLERGHLRLAAIRQDDGTVTIAKATASVPGLRLELTDAQWHPQHGLTALQTLHAQVHPVELYPVFNAWCDDSAQLDLQAQIVAGQIEAKVTSQGVPWAPSAQATISGAWFGAPWRTASMQMNVIAEDPSRAAHVRGSLAGSWAELIINGELQAAQFDVGPCHASGLSATMHATLTPDSPRQVLTGDWSVGVDAVSVIGKGSSLPGSVHGQITADATGLRITADTTAPLVAHAEIRNTTPYRSDTTWAQVMDATPWQARWEISETELSQLAPLLPPGVHVDGLVSGQGEVVDVWHEPQWSAALRMTKANLGGLPPLPPLLQIEAEITANQDGVQVTSMRTLVGGGPVHVHGTFPLPGNPGNLNLQVVSQDALVFQRPDIRVRADADVRLAGTWAAPEVQGRVQVTDLVATTPVSWFGGKDLPGALWSFDRLAALPAPWNRTQLDVQVTGGQDAKKSLEIRNNVVVAALAVDVHLGGKAELPIISGEIRCLSGRLALPFSSYRIDRAALRCNPADPYDPVVEASASTQVQGFILTVHVSGTVLRPHIDVTSSPPLAPEDALVLASTGRLPAEMRRDGTAVSALSVALPFMGRELHRWVVGDGFADDDESLLDRFVVRYDEDRSERGLPTVRLEYQMTGPWYLAGERDRYEAYNLGLMWRWIFGDGKKPDPAADPPAENATLPLADWAVVAAPGVATLPVSASQLLDTVPARQRRGAESRQPAQWASAAQRMVDRLQEAGYPDAIVRPDEVDKGVRFEVTPGQRWSIAATGIQGVPEAHATHVEALVARGLPHGQAPSPSRLAAVRSAVRSHLIQAGYALARVDISVSRESQTGIDATVFIAITPGVHYRFVVKSPTIDGAVSDSVRQHLSDICAIWNGKDWTRREAINLRARLIERLRQHGYVFATVVLSGNQPALLPEVECQIHIVTGQVAVLQAISLRGFEVTSAAYVRQRLQLETGALMAADEPNAALNRLRHSGVARSISASLQPIAPVSVGVTPMADNDQKEVPVELIIVAEEAPPRSIELGAGYGSYEGVRGNALYRDTNVFGWGRTWELGSDLSQRSYGGHTRLIDHDLLGIQRTLSTRLSAGWRREPSFDRTFYASETSVRAPIIAAIDLLTTYTFEAERATERAANADDSQNQGFVLNGVLNANLIWEGRDDRTLPTHGGMAELGFGISDPTLGSQLSYIEWSSRLGWVLPLVSDRFTCAAHVAGTVRRITDGADSLPIQYRLFLGGSTTVRSFGLNQLSPITPEGEALGGLTAGYANIELRTKITGNVHAAAFYDVGKVSERSWTLDGALGQAIGGGMRYHLPIGPLRIDAAYNPGELWAATQSYAIEGAIGFTF